MAPKNINSEPEIYPEPREVLTALEQKVSVQNKIILAFLVLSGVVTIGGFLGAIMIGLRFLLR